MPWLQSHVKPSAPDASEFPHIIVTCAHRNNVTGHRRSRGRGQGQGRSFGSYRQIIIVIFVFVPQKTRVSIASRNWTLYTRPAAQTRRCTGPMNTKTTSRAKCAGAERRSPRTNCISWKGLSRKPNIPTCLLEKNSLCGWTSAKPECRFIYIVYHLSINQI